MSYSTWERVKTDGGPPGFDMYRLKLRAGWLFVLLASDGSPAMAFVPDGGELVGTGRVSPTFSHGRAKVIAASRGGRNE